MNYLNEILASVLFRLSRCYQLPLKLSDGGPISSHCEVTIGLNDDSSLPTNRPCGQAERRRNHHVRRWQERDLELISY